MQELPGKLDESIPVLDKSQVTEVSGLDSETNTQLQRSWLMIVRAHLSLRETPRSLFRITEIQQRS